MRFLCDIPISATTVSALVAAGHDCALVRDTLGPRAADVQIVGLALDDQRIIICFDLDFGALVATSRRKLPSVITLRTSLHSAAFVTHRILAALPTVADDLATGALVTVEDRRVRVRRLPLGA